MQITASKTGLLMQCTAPFERERAGDEPRSEARDDAAAYGSAFHACLLQGMPVTDAAARWGVDAVELEAHLAGKRCPGGRVEQSRAWDVNARRGRVCGFDAATHTYDLRPSEIGGTADAWDAKDGRRLDDVKTGAEYDWWPQLFTLGVMFRARRLRVLHMPRRDPGAVRVHERTFDAAERRAWADRLRARFTRVGEGSFTPGPLCEHCRLRDGCGARGASIVRGAAALLRLAPDALQAGLPDPGRAHMLLAEYDKLSEIARAELRERVRGGEPIVRPDGKVLVLSTRNVERLSKATVTRALGGHAAVAALDDMRARGLLETTPEERLEARAERGK